MENMLKVIALNTKLKNAENFNLHPVVILEGEFVAVGNDLEKKKQTDKFTKRLRVMKNAMDQLHELHSDIKNVLKDFVVYYKLVGTNFGYSILAKQYALLEVAIKKYVRFLKSQEQNPEILSLCEEFSELESLNVFDMMLEDLNSFKPTVEARIEEHKAKYPTFKPNSEVSAEIDLEKIKADFKRGKK